jgi:aminomethyltransferase
VTTTEQTSLKKTSLWDEHKKLGARFVPFSGYDMPVQYTAGVLKEHQAVRQFAGLFDVSHMGVSFFRGPQILQALNALITRDISNLAIGQGAYTLLCRENGGTVDDLIVYRSAEEEIVLVFNASNKEKDFQYLSSYLSKNKSFELEAPSNKWSLIAFQGPKVPEYFQKLALSQWPSNFSVVDFKVDNIPIKIFSTGYTGELGCEILVESSLAPKIWSRLLGLDPQIMPCGLGARDTLRLEMGYSLYGHELEENINPIEAGLSWAVNLKKEKFLGKEALLAAKNSPQKKLIALKNFSKQAPRAGMSVYDSTNKQVGSITSGSYAPSLSYAIGLALVDFNSSAPYSILIRDQKIPFELTQRPFYKPDNKGDKKNV